MFLVKLISYYLASSWKGFQEVLEIESEQTSEILINQNTCRFQLSEGSHCLHLNSRLNQWLYLPGQFPTSGSCSWTRICKQGHLLVERCQRLWFHQLPTLPGELVGPVKPAVKAKRQAKHFKVHGASPFWVFNLSGIHLRDAKEETVLIYSCQTKWDVEEKNTWNRKSQLPHCTKWRTGTGAESTASGLRSPGFLS